MKSYANVDAVLAYGYNLNDLDSWYVKEADDGKLPPLSRYNPEGNFAAQASEYLQQTLRWASAVRVLEYGSDLYRLNLLVAYWVYAEWDAVYGVSNIIVKDTETWDKNLKKAVEILGITPVREQPSWLLSSYQSEIKNEV